jgi:GTP cyclohydrolase III
MKMKRIRYEKTKEDGIWQSKDNFKHPTNGGIFRVYVNKTTNEFRVHDERARMDVHVGIGTTWHKALIEAKKALDRLGINVGDKESRKTQE